MARPRRDDGETKARLTEEAARRYSAGETVRAIAATMDRSYGYVHGLLAESGVAFRKRGGAYRRAPVD